MNVIGTQCVQMICSWQLWHFAHYLRRVWYKQTGTGSQEMILTLTNILWVINKNVILEAVQCTSWGKKLNYTPKYLQGFYFDFWWASTWLSLSCGEHLQGSLSKGLLQGSLSRGPLQGMIVKKKWSTDISWHETNIRAQVFCALALRRDC